MPDSSINSDSYQDSILKDLLIQSQKGDQDAYKELLKSIFPLIRTIVGRKVFNNNDVEDVAQNILMSIHKSLNTYDPKRAPLPWIYTITHRRIIDYIRKTSKINENEVFTEEGDVTIFQDPSNTIIDDRNILAGLSNELRQAVELTKIFGLSTKEASVKLKISESALRTRVSRAITKLRKKLENNTLGDKDE